MWHCQYGTYQRHWRSGDISEYVSKSYDAVWGPSRLLDWQSSVRTGPHITQIPEADARWLQVWLTSAEESPDRSAWNNTKSLQSQVEGIVNCDQAPRKQCNNIRWGFFHICLWQRRPPRGRSWQTSWPSRSSCPWGHTEVQVQTVVFPVLHVANGHLVPDCFGQG